MDNWVRVEGRLPEKEGFYIVYYEKKPKFEVAGGPEIDIVYWIGHWAESYIWKTQEITHWMPLPTAPSKEEV